MKWFDTFAVRGILPAGIASVVLAGLYLAWEPYLGSYLGRFLQSISGGHDSRSNFHADHAGGLQNQGASSRFKPARPLPEGWQTAWRGGKLWIRHYNPNGSVADSLPFDSLRNLYDWIETHPDCCDVNVAKLAASPPETAVSATTTAPVMVSPTSDVSEH